MQAKLEQADAFKEIVMAVKDLVEVMTLEFSPQGLTFQSINASRVCLVYLELSAHSFETFSSPGQLNLSLRSSILNKVLRSADAKDFIRFNMQADSTRLQVEFGKPFGSKLCSFSIGLLQDHEAEKVELPPTYGESKVQMPSLLLAKLISDMGQIGEDVTIEVSEEAIVFEVAGDSIAGQVEVRRFFEHRHGEEVKIVAKQRVRNSYPVRFLSSIARACALANFAYLYFSQNAPAIIEYRLDGGGVLRYYLAPKLEENMTVG